MSGAADHYAAYYADKLWTLLPAVYRAEDTDQFGANGPLRELVNRIGGTAATLRRSIDRLWEDQSIESCDDWVIPYIAQLLDTNLVYGLDARGQRLDVAKTIDYRRRKGTLGLLEELASDITGWDVKVVEFFRRLGRTRHLLDPAIGISGGAGTPVGQLQLAEGLVGARTGTGIGGFADLRNVFGAGQSRSAFDEYFHTADMRAGQGVFGWHAIARLGVFIWRLVSLGAGPVTPVPVHGCPGWYCFDPTGRDIPIFAPPRGVDAFGDVWVSPAAGQLPGPISQALLDADVAAGAAGLGLYGAAMSVWQEVSASPPVLELVPVEALVLRPERGRFAIHTSPPVAQPLASYFYGFPSLIGAGPYDRRGQAVVVPTPAPLSSIAGGGALPAWPAVGTVMLADSLTYHGPKNVSVAGTLTLAAGNAQRPLIRLRPGEVWVMNGTSAEACLSLDGIFCSGGEIVLRGSFASVTLTCCTFDPGTAGGAGALFLDSADGRALAPLVLRIEATIETLCADRCVLGPVRTAGDGAVANASLSNSIVQGIRTSGLGAIAAAEVKDLQHLARALQLGLDPVSALLRTLSPGLAALLGAPASPPLAAPDLPEAEDAGILAALNALLAGPSLYNAADFARVPLSAQTSALLAQTPWHAPAPALNRLLLEDAYPLALADLALCFGDGSLALSRCTVLGRVAAHRLQASECILRELATADDLQDGCIRFCAWAAGSVLPRQYESVSIAQGAPIFTSVSFGQPGFAQLLPDADAQIIPQRMPSTAPQNSISAGAEDGSEMGAYARDKNPIRQQALLLKFQEYMPAGLSPMLIDVT